MSRGESGLDFVVNDIIFLSINSDSNWQAFDEDSREVNLEVDKVFQICFD